MSTESTSEPIADDSPPIEQGLVTQARELAGSLRGRGDVPPRIEPVLILLLGMFEQLTGVVTHLRAEVQRLSHENEAHRRARFGRKSEKMPPMDKELRGAGAPMSRRPRTGAAALDRAELPEGPVDHPVQDDEAQCRCGKTAQWEELASPETSTEYEYRPARLVRILHRRQKKRCRQCGTIVTTAAPAKVIDGGRFGPGLHAHTVVSRCVDAMPLHRHAERWQRAGVPLSASTLCDLFHRSADLLRPLWEALREAVRREGHVHADETPQPVLAPNKTERGYMWIFASATFALYVFARSRSGETPVSVLGGTQGELKVDAYSGYNQVSTPGSRTRSGCLAHARRGLFDARKTDPGAVVEALDLIRELYRVEADAREREIVGTAEHLALRQERSRPIAEKLRAWIDREKPRHVPKGPLGQAVGYLDNQWAKLTLFLDDPKIDLDNNEAERLLRRVALGRKTSLFVGPGDDNGEHLAILLSLCTTCRLNGVDPEVYLADVLIRVQDWPQSRIGELLPDRWAPRPAKAAAA